MCRCFLICDGFGSRSGGLCQGTRNRFVLVVWSSALPSKGGPFGNRKAESFAPLSFITTSLCFSYILRGVSVSGTPDRRPFRNRQSKSGATTSLMILAPILKLPRRSVPVPLPPELCPFRDWKTFLLTPLPFITTSRCFSHAWGRGFVFGSLDRRPFWNRNAETFASFSFIRTPGGFSLVCCFFSVGLSDCRPIRNRKAHHATTFPLSTTFLRLSHRQANGDGTMSRILSAFTHRPPPRAAGRPRP